MKEIVVPIIKCINILSIDTLINYRIQVRDFSSHCEGDFVKMRFCLFGHNKPLGEFTKQFYCNKYLPISYFFKENVTYLVD